MKSLATVVLILMVVRSGATAWLTGNYKVIADPAEKPSIFKPQEYMLEPDLPDIPGIPKVPRAIEIPKIPGLPEIPKIPGVPEIPKIPGVTEIPKIPGVPEIPDLLPTRVCLVVKCWPRWSNYQVCRCVESRK